MKLKKILGISLVCFCFLNIISCSQENKTTEAVVIHDQITGDIVKSPLTLSYPHAAGYNFYITGGSGPYNINNENPEVARIELYNENYIKVIPTQTGNVKLYVTDELKNSVICDMHFAYSELKYTVCYLYYEITGDITDKQKQEIISKVVSNLPQEGGGYKFVYLDEERTSGNAFIYKTEFNKVPIEGIFKNEDPDSFVITADNETRTFHLGTWDPTRMINNQPEAFMEDVTSDFKPDYPKLEVVRTYQYLKEQ